ncbi:MAG: hypothetical protein GXO77_09585 [Calditrichaeota bacterium]|nr:hypothetical protein [Calditrichota bacterium]
MLSLIIVVLLSLNAQSGQPTKSVHGKNFDLHCSACHVTESWRVDPAKINFDHKKTGFTLIGAHSEINCRSCHKDLVFSHIGHACADCHVDIHKGEVGIDCERCHTPESWENRFEIFELHQQTRFPLLGAHAVIDCQSCHTSDQRTEYKLTGVECQQCHLQNFMQALNPEHRKAGFSLDCRKCHLVNASSWKQTVYRHSEAFPLTEGHSGIDCADCHAERYRGTSTDCFACHEKDYNRTVNPDHQIFGFPTVCGECHTSSDWARSRFDHTAVSGFALNGIHGRSDEVKCIDCHVNNQLSGLPKDCFGCHQKDFENAADPNHVAGNFPQDCLTCHNEEAWTPAQFDHNQTAFPLTGAHQSVACENCHKNGQYSGTAADCYSCHETNYAQTTDPDHSQNNFSHDCTQCHTTTAWKPASFDHNQTDFPLTGAHQTLNCIDCHQAGYAGTPTACISCHQENYDSTTDPDHQAANFPTTCEDCHTTTAWKPANWDHDTQYFPIYSGKHQGEWDTCADCHVNASDYSQFECINCHEHNRTDTDDKHKDVTNYVYESKACYDCHPTGRESSDD